MFNHAWEATLQLLCLLLFYAEGPGIRIVHGGSLRPSSRFDSSLNGDPTSILHDSSSVGVH